MLDFTAYPKQWLISAAPLPAPRGGKTDTFAGWHIQAADPVPILRLRDGAGQERGRLIGWVIEGTRFHDADATLVLPQGETLDSFHGRLSGRYVLLWQSAPGQVELRMDVMGGLPAVYAPAQQVVAATTSLIGRLTPLERDADVAQIFDFPRNRGFLPFGLTASRGVHRLLPNHALDLASFAPRRIWPAPDTVDAPKVTLHEARVLAEEAAEIVRRHVHAILDASPEGVPVTLYLSGGIDSRMILAAARGRTDRLVAETIGAGATLDCHVAARLARIAGIPHRQLAPIPSSPAQIAAWLERTGHTIYDPVADITATVTANPPPGQALTGTGCDLSKGKHFEAEDIGQDGIDVDLLLKRIRMPDTPCLRDAASRWLASFPAASAPYTLDLAKIDVIYGCWSSVAGYGHALPLPSLSPFSSRRLNEIVFMLPLDYRRNKGFYTDYMRALWPDLLALPINRAQGLARLRFFKTELRGRIPNSVKRALKPLR